jgi:hypothetical protein
MVDEEELKEAIFTRETRNSNKVEACARCCVKRLKDVYIVNCSARVNLALIIFCIGYK